MATKNPPPLALLKVPAREAQKLRLFVFPHSGSGAFPYRPLASSLPPWVELAIAQLPGREATFGAPMFTEMKELVSALLPLVRAEIDGPYALFGHSFGGHVAFEIVRALRAASAPTPRGLVASGSRAPHIALRRQPIHALPFDRFIDELRRYGGTPEAVLQNQELMELFLPPLRADLGIFETYKAEPGEPLSIPIASFGGRTDHATTPEDIEAWREHTRGPFSWRVFEGGHFYLFEQSKPLFVQALDEALRSFL